MIVLDASVLIAVLDSRDAHHAASLQLLREWVDVPCAASPITLAEVLVGPIRHGRLEAANAALERIDVGEVALPADAASRLAQLRARSGLSMPDCCVLLAAQQGRATVAAFDRKLAKQARTLGLAVVGEERDP